jgi:hypothetical protein
VNVFLYLALFMAVQVFWNHSNHQCLLDADMTIEGDHKNVLFTTAGRLVAVIGASILVLMTQNPR